MDQNSIDPGNAVPAEIQRIASEKRIAVGGFSLLVGLSHEDRALLHNAARERVDFRNYEFCGVQVSGIDRSGAIIELMQDTFAKVFQLLKVQFGARAHFRPRPDSLRDLHVDFYWERAKFGIGITGPNIDDPTRLDNARTRHSIERRRYYEWLVDEGIGYPDQARGLTLVQVPYYVIWHQPSLFVEDIKKVLLNSGAYPKLRLTD